MDPFTRSRLLRFIEKFRQERGQLPTLQDLDADGFDREKVKQGLKLGLIEEFYVTLTNGTIVKGYKVKKS